VLVRRSARGSTRGATPEPDRVQAEISEADAESLVGAVDRDGSTVELELFPANSVFQEEGDTDPRVAAALLEVDGRVDWSCRSS
jgi:hypothetical protein